MSDDAEAGRRGVARALVEDLRAVVAALCEREIPGERLELARQRSGELLALLTGPRRPRWYDGAAGDARPGSGRAYLELSPVRGELNPVAPPLVVERVVEREDGSRTLEATATLGPAYEGPPHGVHGGFVAALFDDLLGQAQGLAGRAGVTATLEVRYRQITPLGEPLRLTAWIHEQRGRRVTARATCHVGDTLTADAEAVFLGVDFEEIRGRMAERRGGRPG